MLRMDLGMMLAGAEWRDRFAFVGLTESQLTLGARAAGWGYDGELIMRSLLAGCDTLEEVSNWCSVHATDVTRYDHI